MCTTSTQRNLRPSSAGARNAPSLHTELTPADRLTAMQREERQTTEWRRRMDESTRLAKEESARSELMLVQTEKRLNDHWTLQIQNMEASSRRPCLTYPCVRPHYAVGSRSLFRDRALVLTMLLQDPTFPGLRSDDVWTDIVDHRVVYYQCVSRRARRRISVPRRAKTGGGVT